MQLMVYAVACPLSHVFCALGELGKVSPTLKPASDKCVCMSNWWSINNSDLAWQTHWRTTG